MILAYWVLEVYKLYPFKGLSGPQKAFISFSTAVLLLASLLVIVKVLASIPFSKFNDFLNGETKNKEQ